jgi:hypothetical protein
VTSGAATATLVLVAYVVLAAAACAVIVEWSLSGGECESGPLGAATSRTTLATAA